MGQKGVLFLRVAIFLAILILSLGGQARAEEITVNSQEAGLVWEGRLVSPSMIISHDSILKQGEYDHISNTFITPYNKQILDEKTKKTVSEIVSSSENIVDALNNRNNFAGPMDLWLKEIAAAQLATDDYTLFLPEEIFLVSQGGLFRAFHISGKLFLHEISPQQMIGQLSGFYIFDHNFKLWSKRTVTQLNSNLYEGPPFINEIGFELINQQ